MMRRNVLFFSSLLIGCFSIGRAEDAKPDNAPSPPKTPAERFADIESRLMNADSATVHFTAASSGAFAADLKGTLRLGPGNRISLYAAGTFGEDSVTLRLDSDGTRMTGGNGEQNFDRESPKALREAIVVGMTRMGLLHNLARLVAGHPPDRASGGARDWLRADSLRATDDAGSAGTGLAFDLFVAGTRAASVALTIGEGGLPIGRTLSVDFPEGTMHVVETYDCVAATGSPAGDR